MFLRCGNSSHWQPESCWSCLLYFFLLNTEICWCNLSKINSEIPFWFLIHWLLTESSVKCSKPYSGLHSPVQRWNSIFPRSCRFSDTGFWQREVLVVCVWFYFFRGTFGSISKVSDAFDLFTSCGQKSVFPSLGQCDRLLSVLNGCMLVCTERMKQISLLIPSPSSLGLHNRILTCGAAI